MAANYNKPKAWKADIARSVDMYNKWFLRFAPRAFRSTRTRTTKSVNRALRITGQLRNIGPDVIREHPEVLSTLRMSTCPPLAVDRLIGLSGVPASLIKKIEKEGKCPVRLKGSALDAELAKIGKVIKRMADPDICVWLSRSTPARRIEVQRAASIIADRLCGAVTNPIIRNAQEQRQLAKIGAWLRARGYTQVRPADVPNLREMERGSFCFRMNVPATLGRGRQVNIPVDAIIMPRKRGRKTLPILIEAKSAGDFANVNKRRKEEATKIMQLRRTYGVRISFNLFLCGYFDTGYLGYEAAEGIDWVWEHRIDDLSKLGL